MPLTRMNFSYHIHSHPLQVRLRSYQVSMVEHVLKDFLFSGFDSAIFIIIVTTNTPTQCLPCLERKINLKGLIAQSLDFLIVNCIIFLYSIAFGNKDTYRSSSSLP
jgi:hypothetical protein